MDLTNSTLPMNESKEPFHEFSFYLILSTIGCKKKLRSTFKEGDTEISERKRTLGETLSVHDAF